MSRWNSNRITKLCKAMRKAKNRRMVTIEMWKWLTRIQRRMLNWCQMRNFGRYSWVRISDSRRSHLEVITLYSSRWWRIPKNTKIDTSIISSKFFWSRIGHVMQSQIYRRRTSLRKQKMTSILLGISDWTIYHQVLGHSRLTKRLTCSLRWKAHSQKPKQPAR